MCYSITLRISIHGVHARGWRDKLNDVEEADNSIAEAMAVLLAAVAAEQVLHTLAVADLLAQHNKADLRSRHSAAPLHSHSRRPAALAASPAMA